MQQQQTSLGSQGNKEAYNSDPNLTITSNFSVDTVVLLKWVLFRPRKGHKGLQETQQPKKEDRLSRSKKQTLLQVNTMTKAVHQSSAQ